MPLPRITPEDLAHDLPHQILSGNVDRQTLRHRVVLVQRHELDPERYELRYGQQDGEAPDERDADLEVSYIIVGGG